MPAAVRWPCLGLVDGGLNGDWDRIQVRERDGRQRLNLKTRLELRLGASFTLLATTAAVWNFVEPVYVCGLPVAAVAVTYCFCCCCYWGLGNWLRKYKILAQHTALCDTWLTNWPRCTHLHAHRLIPTNMANRHI